MFRLAFTTFTASFLVFAAGLAAVHSQGVSDLSHPLLCAVLTGVTVAVAYGCGAAADEEWKQMRDATTAKR